ncbi:YbdK family carboxylate-amine ligase [Kitasatospora sp. NPDC059571]|uniref:carboxylate-amine ligase n=1 Tax=Kitasatospora sp. NPDC059571 TaxID=3346871 RepID=UPI00368EDBB9
MTAPAVVLTGDPTTRAEVTTVGVEEEFLLVECGSHLPARHGPAVVEAAAAVLGDQVQTEFFASQAEVCSSPTRSLDALRAELGRLRAVLREAATAAGCLLVGSGTPVVAGGTPPVTGSARYRRIRVHVGSVATAPDGSVSGCHIHVGVRDRAQALALNRLIRPWLPVVQALAVNSPFSCGRDTGFASWRHPAYRRWPTVGPAPVVDEAGYLATVGALLDSRVILDPAMLYWYSRPSEHVPTLEIRIADTSADLDTTVLLAALVRALASVFLAELRSEPDGAGPEARSPGTALVDAAHWASARHGLHGAGPHPATGLVQPMRVLVDALVERALPGLDAAGDTPFVLRTLGTLLSHGTGADRQRAVYGRRGRLGDVVGHLAEATAAGAAG